MNSLKYGNEEEVAILFREFYYIGFRQTEDQIVFTSRDILVRKLDVIFARLHDVAIMR